MNQKKKLANKVSVSAETAQAFSHSSNCASQLHGMCFTLHCPTHRYNQVWLDADQLIC